MTQHFLSKNFLSMSLGVDENRFSWINIIFTFNSMVSLGPDPGLNWEAMQQTNQIKLIHCGDGRIFLARSRSCIEPCDPIRIHHWCWYMTLCSGALFLWLFWNVELYLMSLLQIFFMGIAIYGLFKWDPNSKESEKQITKIKLKNHLYTLGKQLHH